MHKQFIAIAAKFGALAVAIGAFGAHGLQSMTQDEKILHSFQTGVQYQMYHVLALLAVGILFEKFPSKKLIWSGYSFIIGILLFSGSIYAITFLKINGSDLVKILGPITPLGGLFFIVGWLFLLLGVFKKN